MDVLRAHAAAGRTLFLSIHQLTDAARICDRFVLLSGGRVVGEGTLDELRDAGRTSKAVGSRRCFLPSRSTEFALARPQGVPRARRGAVVLAAAARRRRARRPRVHDVDGSVRRGERHRRRRGRRLSQGLRPLEGILVPTFGAYDLAATLLFPFVVIRLVAAERQTGALSFTLQAPTPLGATIVAKGDRAARCRGSCAMLAGVVALARVAREWAGISTRPKPRPCCSATLLRGALTIGIASAAAALSASAASAAIVALTITLGHMGARVCRRGARRVDRRGGGVHAVRGAARVRARRASRVHRARAAHSLRRRSRDRDDLARRRRDRSARASSRRPRIASASRCSAAPRVSVRASRDVSEDRRNSFPRADEAALRSINAPLHVTVYLAAEDPRLVDLERDVLSKLRRTMRHVDVVYAAGSRSGLFERPGDHYGEVWYELNGRREMTRSGTQEIVLETIYRLAGRDCAERSRRTSRTLGIRSARVRARRRGCFSGSGRCSLRGAWFAARRPRSRRVSI